MSVDANQPPAPRGVLLTTNVLFSSMVTGTASAQGHQVAVAENLAEALDLCRDRPCNYVIVDLGMSELSMQSAVSQLRALTGPIPMIAFGSHIDKERLDEARAAGCDEVMPRSKFSAELPALLRRCCSNVV